VLQVFSPGSLDERSIVFSTIAVLLLNVMQHFPELVIRERLALDKTRSLFQEIETKSAKVLALAFDDKRRAVHIQIGERDRGLPATGAHGSAYPGEEIRVGHAKRVTHGNVGTAPGVYFTPKIHRLE